MRVQSSQIFKYVRSNTTCLTLNALRCFTKNLFSVCIDRLTDVARLHVWNNTISIIRCDWHNTISSGHSVLMCDNIKWLFGVIDLYLFVIWRKPGTGRP